MADWTTRELDLRARLMEGQTVVVNQRTDRTLVAWCKEVGLLAPVDRRTQFGNPYPMKDQKDSVERAQVCDRYEHEHLPARPDLLAAVPSLQGKALACWCAPARCHADTLAALASGSQGVAQVADKAPPAKTFYNCSPYGKSLEQRESATSATAPGQTIGRDDTSQDHQTTGQSPTRHPIDRPLDNDWPPAGDREALADWLQPRPGEDYDHWNARVDAADALLGPEPDQPD